MLSTPTSLPTLPRAAHRPAHSSPRAAALLRTRKPVFELHSTSPESFIERTMLRDQLDKASRTLVEFREGMEPRVLSVAELEELEMRSVASDAGSWVTDGGLDCEGGGTEDRRSSHLAVVDSGDVDLPSSPSPSPLPSPPIRIEGFDLPSTSQPLPRRPSPSRSPSILSTLLASSPSPPLPSSPPLDPPKPAWNDNALLLALAAAPRSTSPSPALTSTPAAPYPPTRFLVSPLSTSPPTSAAPTTSTRTPEQLELRFVRRPESVRTGSGRVVLGSSSRSPSGDRRARGERKRRASSGGDSDDSERAYIFEPSVFASHRSNSCASLSSATSLPRAPSLTSSTTRPQSPRPSLPRPQSHPQPSSSWMALPPPGLAPRIWSEGEQREGTLKRLRREQEARRLEAERVEKERAGEKTGRRRRLFFF